MTKPFWNAARAAQHRKPHKRSVLQAIGTPLPEAVASLPGCKGCGYIKCSCPKKVMAVTVPEPLKKAVINTPTPYEIHRLDYNRALLRDSFTVLKSRILQKEEKYLGWRYQSRIEDGPSGGWLHARSGVSVRSVVNNQWVIAGSFPLRFYKTREEAMAAALGWEGIKSSVVRGKFTLRHLHFPYIGYPPSPDGCWDSPREAAIAALEHDYMYYKEDEETA